MSRCQYLGHSRFCLNVLCAVMFLFYLPPVIRGDAVGGPEPVVAEKPKGVTATYRLHAVFSKKAPENVADLLAIERRVQQLVKQVSPYTVAVQIGRAQGSGVIVSKDGYVLTAAHVAGAPGRNVTFVLSDGRKIKGKTLGLNRSLDAGLMKITDKGEWPFAEIGDIKTVKAGDWCVAMGHPGGYQTGRPPVVRLGRVLRVNKRIIHTDCTLVGGDSGGPLFDRRGKVIGIHSRIGAPTTWNFHVPISAYTNSWERLVASEMWGGFASRGTAILGVRGENDEHGCRITEVDPTLPAKKAGLQVGDVIVKLDGKIIKGFEGLVAAVIAKKPGDKVTLEILRGEEMIEIMVVLAKRG